MYKELVYLEYLEFGLIPVNGFSEISIQEFEKMLESLSDQDRRKVNRKFRKIFRKTIRREMSNQKRPTAGWDKLYGLNSPKPTPRQMRARRRLVHREITNAIYRRLRHA